MESVTLGSTRLNSTALGLGLAALGRPDYRTLHHSEDIGEDHSPEAMRVRCHAVLDAAREAGVRHFDVGPAQGKSEEFLRDWLKARELEPDEVTVASKWGYSYAGEWSADSEEHVDREHSLENLRRQWERSSEILGPHLQLYQIRSATIRSGVLEDSRILEELTRLKEEGLHIGVSVTGPNQDDVIRQALEISHDGEPLFETLQATWNLLERSAATALGEAKDAGLGIIVKESLANGRLTTHNDDPTFANDLGTLKDEAERLGTTVDALALAAALNQPWADVVLCGAATPEQMRSNIGAMDVQLDGQAKRRLLSIETSPDVYWEATRAMPYN